MDGGASDSYDDDHTYPDVTPPDDPERAAKQRAQNRMLLRRYITDVLGAGDLDVVEEIYHEDIELNARPVNTDRTVSGHDAVKEYMAGIRDRFRNLETEVNILLADQVNALAKFTVSAVHQDDYFGVDPSRREVTFPVFSMAEIKDNKMIDQGDLVNPLSMQPPAKRYGRSSVLDQIREGILVVDEQDRIVDSNPVAEELLADGDEGLLDERLQTVIGADVTLPETGSSVEVRLQDHVLDLSASELIGPDDTQIGQIYHVRDVTERVRRRQQLEVLNRVLRHNLRNKLNSVIGRAEFIAENERQENPDIAKIADTIIESAQSLASLGATARNIEQAISQGDELQRHPLAESARQAVRQGNKLYPAATIETDLTSMTVTAPPVLDDAVWEIVENAIEHTGGDQPWIAVRTEHDGEYGSVVVADEGTGVPENERAVLASGQETQLEHASGLGLWFAYLTTEIAGGELQFETRDATENAVRLTFPLAE